MKDIRTLPDAHLRIFERPPLPEQGSFHDAYLVGICGTGMGALAGLLTEAGYTVRGADAAAYPPMSTRLAEMGIGVLEGFDAAHLDPPPSLVVVGNACTPTHPEAAAARDRGLAQASLPEAIAAYFIGDRRSIVVAGTHGKTTTTSLLVHVMRTAGLDPGFLVGGVMRNGMVSQAVGSGGYFVIEGDEYDSAYFDKRPKFLHYRPRVAIVTSMEFDHADIYASWNDYREAFRTFTSLLPEDGHLVLNVDDPEVRRLSDDAGARITGYGLEDGAAVTARDIRPGDDGQTFRLVLHGQDVGRFHLPLSGRHNLANTLAIAAVALDEGVAPDALREGLATFAGIRRRQEVRGTADDVIVVDDFAHHPTAVRATLQSVRERWPARRLVAVFEPRSNSSRRRVFQDGYIEAFSLADRAYLSTPPFRHNDSVDDFLDMDAVVRGIASAGVPTFSRPGAEAILETMLPDVQPGDVVLVMSNGGFGGLHDRLLAELRARNADVHTKRSSPAV